MNKCYFAFGTILLLSFVTGALQAQQPTPPSSGTKIIIIEEKVDRQGNKTVTKTISEGNFTDEEIEKIIAEESGDGKTAQVQTQDEKGYLGVMIENADGGVRITEVIDGSPAQTAGLQAGDIITAIDETVVTNMESLVQAVSSHKPGETVQVHYRRADASASANVTLAVREEPEISDVFEWEEHVRDMKEHEKEMKAHEEEMKRHEEMMKEHEKEMKAERKKDRPRFGVTIDDIEDGPGVLVTSVYEGSLAEQIGIREGDIITSFNGVEVNSPDALIEAVNAAPADDKVKVVFLRDGKKMKEKATFPRT